MYQMEVSADAIEAWADLKPLDHFNLLQAARKNEPTASQCYRIAAYMMRVDLHRAMVKEAAPANQILANVTGFYKFCGAELHMPKKDLPKSLTDRIDKCAKAAKIDIIKFKEIK